MNPLAMHSLCLPHSDFKAYLPLWYHGHEKAGKKKKRRRHNLLSGIRWYRAQGIHQVYPSFKQGSTLAHPSEA